MLAMTGSFGCTSPHRDAPGLDRSPAAPAVETPRSSLAPSHTPNDHASSGATISFSWPEANDDHIPSMSMCIFEDGCVRGQSRLGARRIEECSGTIPRRHVLTLLEFASLCGFERYPERLDLEAMPDSEHTLTIRGKSVSYPGTLGLSWFVQPSGASPESAVEILRCQTIAFRVLDAVRLGSQR